MERLKVHWTALCASPLMLSHHVEVHLAGVCEQVLLRDPLHVKKTLDTSNKDICNHLAWMCACHRGHK